MRRTDWVRIAGLALRDLLRRPGHALVGFLGFFLPVAAFAVVVALSSSAGRETSAILRSTGTHFVASAPACDDCRGEYLEASGRGSRFGGQAVKHLPERLLERIRGLPEVADASPFLMQLLPWNGELVYVGGFDTANRLAAGTTCCAASDVKAGRFLAPGERGALLLDEGFSVARRLKPGDALVLEGRSFTVAGVVNPGIRPAKAEIMMNLEDAAAFAKAPAAGAGPPFNLVLVEVRDAWRQDAAIAKVRALAGEVMSELVTSSYACYRPAGKVAAMERRAMCVVTIAAFLLAMLLVARNQFAAVEARRRELAVLLVSGWSRAQVFASVLSETLFLAVAGGLAGLAAGPAAVLSPSLDSLSLADSGGPFVAAVVALSTAAAGLLAGLAPALRAARLKPMETLRDG